MSNERGRHQLYEELKSVMSQDSADELMSYLPPVGWADVATKADLGVIRNEMDSLRAEMRGEMALLRGEMDGLRGEFAELRGEFGTLGGEFGTLRGEFGTLRGDVGTLRGEFGTLRGDFGLLEGRMDRAFAAQTRWMVGAIFAAVPLGILLSHAVT